jgi:hypothetical protein
MENRGPYGGGETFMRPVNTAPAPAMGGKPANGSGKGMETDPGAP